MTLNNPITPKRRRAVLLIALGVLAPALASGGQVRDRDATWLAPIEHAAKANPFVTRTDLAVGGRKVFLQRCSTCHGEEGRGSTKAPDLTQAAVQEQTDGALFWKISSGNAHQGMPTFSFLPERQRWQVVLYLRVIGAAHP